MMGFGYRSVGLLIGLTSIALGILAAASPVFGLQPCGSLDVSLELSGCLRSFEGYSAVLDPHGDILAVAALDRRTVELKRIENSTTLRVLESGIVSSLTFSPSGETLAVGTSGNLQLWRVADGALMHELSGHAEHVTSAAFSPDGTMVATAVPNDAVIRVWSTLDGSLLQSLAGHRLGTREVQFAPDGALLGAVLGDGTATIWATKTWRPSIQLIDPAFFIQSLTFGPGSQTLVASSGRLLLRLLSAGDGSIVRELRGDVAVFSPDGSVVATANGGLHLWRATDGAELHRLEGHGFEVEDVSFSPDGTRLVSAGGYEGTVRIWRASDGALERTIEVPDGRATLSRVTGAEFLADGRTLISRQGNGARELLRVWSPDYAVANLPKWLGVLASIGLGLATLVLGLPSTRSSAWPGRWVGGILLIGGSFMLWGPLWLLAGDGTNYVVIFFGAVLTFSFGLRQINRSYRWRLRWR